MKNLKAIMLIVGILVAGLAVNTFAQSSAAEIKTEKTFHKPGKDKNKYKNKHKQKEHKVKLKHDKHKTKNS